MANFNEIKTRNELADFLNVPRKHFSYILYVRGINNFYSSFEIKKKNGGIRNIYAPSKELKNIQRKLAAALYTHIKKKCNKTNNISHGFEKNKNIITNAKYIVIKDLY